MTNKNLTPYIVALDWGTSSFRARVITKNAEIIDFTSTDEGILTSNHQFLDVLENNLKQLKGYKVGMPIVMSGMIGSRNGWYEAPYTVLPCNEISLAQKLKFINLTNSHQIYIIPGLMKTENIPDVIRGEETEIIGAIKHLDLKSSTMLIPGSHSKLIKIEEGNIIDFKTYLTGEMFHAICTSTILGRFGCQVNTASNWFTKGVRYGLNIKYAGDLLNILFTARSRVLISDMPPEESASFISGLLIGSEIGASDFGQNTVWIMGNGTLPKTYQTALNIAGIKSDVVPENIITIGTLSIFNQYKQDNI